MALIGDRALKFLKPIRTAFLDQSTPALRAAACDQELRLNRRLSPDVYLGLGEVREGDEVVDTFLVMRRMPDRCRLSGLLDSDGVAAMIRDVARQVAAFHLRQTPSARAARLARAEWIGGLWQASLDQMEAQPDQIVDRAKLAQVRRLAGAYVAGRSALFEQRIEQGWARDGHGDLLCEDIFVLDEGVRILDCLAFDEELRCGDVLLDVAFLAMDLEHLGHPELAATWLSWYSEFTAERHPASLAHHYVAYRALVRSKITALRAGQGATEAAEGARELLDLCLTHLSAAAPVMTLVGGNPGVGKSTVAEELASRSGSVLLSSDPLRKELAGIDHSARRTGPLDAGIYSAEFTDQVYGELLQRAERLLALGESVIIDASWLAPRHRDEARRVASGALAEIVEIRCVLEPALARARVGLRMGDDQRASDADPALAEALAGRAEPWPEAVELSTEPAVEIVAEQALQLIVGVRSHRRDRA